VTTTRGTGPSTWIFVGTCFAIGAYVLLVVISIAQPEPGNLAALVVAPTLVVLTLPIAVRMARADGDPTVVGIVLVAVSLKLAASIVRYFVAIDVYGGTADAIAYHDAGRLLFPAFRALDFSVPTARIPGTGFIQVLTGLLYTGTGASRLAGFFFFAWLGMLGQILCWRAFRIGVPSGDSKRYAVLVLLFPSMLYWPSSIGKEAWMLLTIGLTAYGVARVLRRLRWGLTLTFVGIVGVTMVRPHIALILLASLLVALTLMRWPSDSTLAPVLRFGAIVVVVIATLVVVNQTETFFGVESLDRESVQQTLSSTELQTAQGSSSFTPVPVDTPVDLPFAAGTVLFRPLPWEATNTQMLATAAEGLLLAVLCLVSWRRIASVPRLLRSTPFVTFALAYVVLFIYAFSSFANFGILARQRTQVFPFLFVLLALPVLASRRGSFVERSLRRQAEVSTHDGVDDTTLVEPLERDATTGRAHGRPFGG
jgi:hypothetical protein